MAKYIRPAVIQMDEPAVARSNPETAVVIPEQSIGLDGLPNASNRIRLGFSVDELCRSAGHGDPRAPPSRADSDASISVGGVHNALEDQASIAKARTVHRPRDRQYCPHTKTKPIGLECRPARNTAHCRFGLRRAGQREFPTRRPTLFLCGPQAVLTPVVYQAPGTGSSLAPFQLTRPASVPIQRVPSRAGEHLSDCGAREMLTRWWLPGHTEVAIEAKQAEFRAEPKDTHPESGPWRRYCP